MTARGIIQALSGAKWRRLVSALDDADCLRLVHDWTVWVDDLQALPDHDWSVALMMAGRGFGKTRSGAEWVRALAARYPGIRIALVGGTLADARAVMVEGESGILAVCLPHERPVFEPSLGRLRWPNGTLAFLYSGENPERLRGPQHHFAWCDELAKWGRAKDCWSNLQLGLRMGRCPQTLVTTTPRPTPLMRRLVADERVPKLFGKTQDNPHLPDRFIARMIADYAGTRLGRQELDGALIDDFEGALWTRDLIERCREGMTASFQRIVIGVDPPAGTDGDACGIIAVGLGTDGHARVIEDASVSGQSPEGWARAVAACAERVGADRVIAEANNGGKMVESVLRGADRMMPITLVHASHGKVARAEPVLALFEAGRAWFAGTFPALEDELCGLVTGGGYQGPGKSPDRADAMVWAMTALMLGKGRAEPRVRVL
jgi:phage terminase large subunit-like protein